MTTSTSNSKPYAFLLAALICLILRFGDLFLPVNFFTHRLWEALIIHKKFDLLPGTVYPHQKIFMKEEGDLAPRTPLAVKKNVVWQTDRHGYRKADSDRMDYPVVIVGDSTILGTSLDQKDMLSEVLEQKMKKPVYPFAPYYEMETFLTDTRFRQHKPNTVVFAMMEWAMPDVLTAKAPTERKKINASENLAILMDRSSKLSLMRFVDARVRTWIKSLSKHKSVLTVPYGNRKIMFPLGTGAHPDLPLELADKIAEKIYSYQKEAGRRGIKFIFLPIPNKETVYYSLISGKPEPVFLKTLMKKMEERGVNFVDFRAVLHHAFINQKKFLYQPDDTHWDPDGVRLAVELLIEKIKENS